MHIFIYRKAVKKKWPVHEKCSYYIIIKFQINLLANKWIVYYNKNDNNINTFLYIFLFQAYNGWNLYIGPHLAWKQAVIQHGTDWLDFAGPGQAWLQCMFNAYGCNLSLAKKETELSVPSLVWSKLPNFGQGPAQPVLFPIHIYVMNFLSLHCPYKSDRSSGWGENSYLF